MGIIGCALIEISALPQLHGSGRLPSVRVDGRGARGCGGRCCKLNGKWKHFRAQWHEGTKCIPPTRRPAALV